MASASDIERLHVRTSTPGLLSPGSALTRVSPTKNKRRCSSTADWRSAGLASVSGAVGSSPSTQPAIITTGELRPLLLCRLMIRTSATSGGISGRDTAAISASNNPAAVSALVDNSRAILGTVHRQPLALQATAPQTPEHCL